MRPTLVIDTDAVRDLAAQLGAAARRAESVRTHVLHLLVAAELDDASTVHALDAVDEELRLVRAVLLARADRADYPLPDAVGFALDAVVEAATQQLQLVAGPDRARAAEGREAARRLVAAGAGASEALLRSILSSSSDPSFARGFAEALSLRDAAALVLDHSSADPAASAARPVTPQERAVWSDRQALLLDALGRAYAQAARWTGPSAVQAASASAWVAAITQDPASASARSGRARAGEGAALALLAAHGGFDDAWLVAVTDGVYRYERATAAGSSPLWSPRSRAGTDWAGPLAPDGTHAYDPLAGLLGALGASAPAAQAFFAAGGTVDVDGDGALPAASERLAYLLQARRWPTDGGAGLGAALAAATTEIRDHDAAGRLSAQLASQLVALVGTTTGDGRGRRWGIERPGWQAPHGIRPALAEIVVSYMPDVFQTVQSAAAVLPPDWSWDGTAGFPPHGPYAAAFRTDDLAIVVEAIGTDVERTRRVVAAVLGTERLRLAAAIDDLSPQVPDLAADFLTSVGGGPRVSRTSIENAVAAAGATLGFVVQHGYVGLDDQQAREIRARQQVSDLLQVAVTLPVVPVPGGAWGKALIKPVTKGVFQAWVERAPHDAGARYGAIDEEVADTLRTLVLDDLLAHGLLHPAQPIVGFAPPPVAALVRGADGLPVEPKRFDRQTRAYLDWASTYAPNAWLQTQVSLFYDAAFPHLR